MHSINNPVTRPYRPLTVTYRPLTVRILLALLLLAFLVNSLAVGLSVRDYSLLDE
jgi:hypothetical protein